MSAAASKGTAHVYTEASVDTPCRIALVGRPNSGKSSLYNRLTGGNARVGNYPGITVEVLEANVTLPSGKAVTIADLPGLYSVEATVAKDTDESVAKGFLESLKHPRREDSKRSVTDVAAAADASSESFLVIQVIDPTRLALGLRLTHELLSARMPLLIALTHKDVLKAEGRDIDVDRLSESLGVPVVLVDARDPASKLALYTAIDDRLRDRRTGVGDEARSFDPNKLAAQVLLDVASTSETKRRREMTARLDSVLLHPLIGPFLFLGIMAVVFAAVFLVADPVSGFFDKVNTLARSWLDAKLGKGLVASFLADGILGGAGTVLAFMPQIVILTVALEILEASGYLARGAFLVDRILRLLGLSGRSFLPLLMGHACAVPAISATRVVRDPRERLTTILVLPLMTCSARLPTYALVIAAFFSTHSAIFRACLFVGLYFSGILTALVASFVLRRTATKGRGLPLVLELPAYRVPQTSVVVRKAYRASQRFLRDVGKVIVVVSAALWMLLSIPMPGSSRNPDAPEIEASIAASIGHAVEPLTKPAGFDWKIDIGLIGSFGARELMVATMGVVYGVENAADDAAPLAQKLREAKHSDGAPVYGARTGLALLAFFVLACQCMSTVAAIRRETRTWRWPLFVLFYTYALGYAAAVLVYQVAGVFGVS